METIKSLIDFLDSLEKNGIYYKLGKIRDSALVEAVVPGQRWEIEFMSSGDVEIEKFLSDGTIYDSRGVETLLKEFGDYTNNN